MGIKKDALQRAKLRAEVERDIAYRRIVKEMTGAPIPVVKKFHVYGWPTFQSPPVHLGDMNLSIMEPLTFNVADYVRIEFIECAPAERSDRPDGITHHNHGVGPCPTTCPNWTGLDGRPKPLMHTEGE